LDRFENVLARELNVPVLFYTVLACLHLDDIDSALEYLEQLQECIDPGDAVYSETIEHIITFIASKQSGAEVAATIDAEVPVPVPPKVSDQQKILVVEDSQTTRKVIKMTLQGNGYKVVEARDGVEALTKINDEQPDLILLDVMLPKLDGYSILTILKQNNAAKKVPVIMLTSKDGLKDRIRGRFSSASAYLTKPFKPDLLLKKIEQFI
jgi:twitching motility two-component system response regulator PilG